MARKKKVDNDIEEFVAEITELGQKFDSGKPTFDLLPDDALAGIQKVLEFGAHKYAERNWEYGFNWRRAWNACLRHLWAWMRREDVDPESGLPTLWHAGCEILFLIAFQIRCRGCDDRPPAPPEALCGPDEDMEVEEPKRKPRKKCAKSRRK